MKKLVKSLCLKNEQGSVAVLIALSMVAFISLIALSIDIGYALVTRDQLQNVADSAALAATRQLGENIKLGLPMDPSPIITVAQQAAVQNKAGGKYITINASDVTIGKWDSDTKILTQTLINPDAVKVTSRRDASSNGPITTFFAGIFGANSVRLTAFATAALTGQGTALPGGLPFPAAISQQWFTDPSFCGKPITFSPPATSCAGWHTYTDPNANATNIKKILNGLRDGTFTSPEVIAGQTQLNFTNGDVASAFTALENLFNAMKGKNDGVLDLDSDPNTWTTSVAVYDASAGCSPNGAIPIVGFAATTITSVVGPPNKIVNANIKCDSVGSGRGGGSNYGTRGSIPGLVQ